MTVFRGRIDCCDLMKELYKGQVLQTAIIVRGKYCLYYAKLVFNCLCVIIFERRQDGKISSGICQKSKDEVKHCSLL